MIVVHDSKLEQVARSHPVGDAPSRGRTSVLTAALCAVGIASLVAASGCAAVYPEIETPMRPPPADAKLDPEPPEDLLYIQVEKAQIPRKTRDGREWDSVGGSLPDPFAIVFIDDKELFRTPVHENTLSPTWPDSPRANYRIPIRSRMRFELWDSNTLTHRPICVHTIDNVHQQAEYGFVDVSCESGARASIVVRHARALLGLGFYYELRAEDVYVTRVLEESPASRVGLKPDVRIVSIQGQPTRGMDLGEVRSYINANERTGVTLDIRRPDGRTDTVTLKAGPIYPVAHEHIKLP